MMDISFDRRKTGRTLIMGILNCTPDSFSDGGKFFGCDEAVVHACRMMEEGADIIDIGGESTRPGFTPVDAEEEKRRVIPVFRALSGRGALLSADTTKPEVAAAAVEAGCNILNDISGDLRSSGMAEIAAANDVDLVIMFNCRRNGPCVDGIMEHIDKELAENIDYALSRGVSEDRIIIDPGIGFGTTREQDILITRQIGRLTCGRYPLLYAASRKRVTAEFCDGSDDMSLRDSVSDALALYAASKGASIIRSHRVRELKSELSVFDRLYGDK